MFNKKIFGIFLGIFFFIRIFSFLFTPTTPLLSANPINHFLSFLILLITGYFLIKRDIRGWYIIAVEIILGGSGSYLEIFSVSLRTILLILSLSIFLFFKLKDKQIEKITKYKFFPIIFVLLIWAGISSLIGFKNEHSLNNIFSDTIPYLFFLYYFPLKEMITQQNNFLTIIKNALFAVLIGNFIIIAFTFLGFSFNLFVLQDQYYHWYRDVAAGKITELPYNFFRLVLNEHLLIIPILIWLFNDLIEQKNKLFNHFLAILTILVLAVNLTRIYFLAFFTGILLSFRKNNWIVWLKYSVIFLLSLIISFTAIHFGASRGKSFGWEIFGLRLQSIAAPQIEGSSLSRMLLLPKIKEKIISNPIWGNGLGDIVTVYSPIFKHDISTPHFDWGYLEIWAELGVIGLILWLTLIIMMIKILPSKLLPVIGSLLIINLTSPALFHVFGIILLVFLMTQEKNKYVGN